MPLQEHKKRGQLRDTFILLFILISCIPILGLGIISLLGIAETHKKNVSELEQQTLIRSADMTSTFFTNVIDTLSTNFDTLDDASLSVATTSWQQMYAEKFVNDNKAFLEVSFINLQGKEVAKYSKINNTTNPLYLSELPLFQKALRGEIAISEVHTTLNGQAVTIAVPSLLNGKVFNVVMAEVSLSPLITSLEKIRVGKTGYVLLFDTLGTFIGSKDVTNSSHLSFFSWSRLQRVLQGESFNALLPDDRYQSLISSVPVVSSAKRIPKINWALFVEWPIVESDAIIENFRNTVLGTIFVSIIIVLLVASLLANHLVRPIRLLQEATTEIEKGNFDKQVSIATNNELEELADSFNGMALGLKRLEELKNEFVYVAAHELRAPVTAIKGYLELVFDGDAGTLTPEMEHLLSPVRKANNRLVNLVNDLLQVARSEAGKLEIVISPSEITKEIVAILEEIKPLALKRNMTIHYTPQENLPLVAINTGSFKEVIMNFASNAVKYGNDNGTITVSHSVEGDLVSTSIADNGRGMSEEDQKHLFEKFFRASDVKKTSIEGTGLGLFITKEIVEKMDGTLAVVSELGKGTTFTVTFKKAAGTNHLQATATTILPPGTVA